MSAAIDIDLTSETPPVGRDGRIHLLSPIGRLRLSLQSPSLEYDAQGVRREVPGTRKMVVFRGGRASIPTEWWPLLKRARAFTGVGKRRSVYLDGEEGAVAAQVGGPTVITGARHTAIGTQMPPPLEGWDQMTLPRIREAIRQGRVEDPTTAMVYEGLNRRRTTVLKSLAAVLSGQAVDIPNDTDAGEEPTPDAPIAETAVAAVPAGQRVD